MSPLLLALAKAFESFFGLLALSLVLFTHQRELTPLYGSGATTQLLQPITTAAAVITAVQPFKIPSTARYLLTAIALTLAPNATYWTAVYTARRKDAFWGPALTHIITVVPLVFLLLSGRARGASTSPDSVLSSLVRTTSTFAGAKVLSQKFLAQSPLLYVISDSHMYLVLAAAFYNIFLVSFLNGTAASSVKRKSSSKKGKSKAGPSTLPPASIWSSKQLKAASIIALNGVLLSVWPRFTNPILPHPLPSPYRHPTFPLEILSAEQSVTGLITVAEWVPPPDYKGEVDAELHSARYLRADHSILGGVWTRDKAQVWDVEREPPVQDAFGNHLGDSIYSAFVLQEAARLVNSIPAGKTGKWQNSLIIGLGTGISATSFIRHGLNTTIVEIDPAVYRAARTYFGLPDPGPNRAFLQDARAWTSRQRGAIEAGQPAEQYDIVVHDCFSGGGVPEHIFTTEFWEDLKVVMKPDSVLAVNFAGIPRSDSSRHIIHTLEKTFGECRAFHDLFDQLSDEKYDTEFINMVIFCNKSEEPITFRKTKRSDWLNSPLRRHILLSLPEREVNLTSIRGSYTDEQYVLTDKKNPLGALQQKQGSHHWEVMRQVLSDKHWETF